MLTHLHEAAVLDSLNLRFDVDEIYTFTGPILIAVNPFKQIAGLYDMKVRNTQHRKDATHFLLASLLQLLAFLSS